MASHRDLEVYQLAFESAMKIYDLTHEFPKEERYALIDQIRRSSRSVVANIAEGYRKRQYPRMFASKIADSDGEAAETQTWLDFSLRCGYITTDQHGPLMESYQSIGRMLGSMILRPERFVPAHRRRR